MKAVFASIFDLQILYRPEFFRGPYFHYSLSSVHYCEDPFIFISQYEDHIHDFHIFSH